MKAEGREEAAGESLKPAGSEEAVCNIKVQVEEAARADIDAAASCSEDRANMINERRELH